MQTIQNPVGPGAEEEQLVPAVACLLRFGATMLRSGTVSLRVREGISCLGRAMGLHRITVDLAFDAITLTAGETGRSLTSASRVSGFGINAYRLGMLEHMVASAQAPLSAATIEAQLDIVDATPPLRSVPTVVFAVAAACAAFACLNNGGPSAMFGAAIGGGIGQWLRMKLLARKLNQFALTAICAVVATAAYCLVAAGLTAAGFDVPVQGAGFISSALFLVPGFPLVAAVVDLLQTDLSIGVTRLAYGIMLVLAGAFGICMVAAAAHLSAAPLPPRWDLGPVLHLLPRGAATFIGACGFAILYNSTWRTVWTVGLLALVGNEIRLGLNDAGVALASATFIGALTVGLMSTAARRFVHEPRIALSVPGVVIMTPGTFADQALIHFNQGDISGALAYAVPGGFVVGAMAVGLAAARLLTDRAWLYDK
jgi:uncharacterized membrane protein YjjP (DUF1212 family)